MTDEELRRIYDDACHTAGGYIHPRPAALRAVFLAGARAQREMEPTEEMLLRGGIAVSDIYAKEGGWCGVEAAKDQVVATYRAMQRVAPLVGGEG